MRSHTISHPTVTYLRRVVRPPDRCPRVTTAPSTASWRSSSTSRAPRSVTLTELAIAVGAARSSTQQLVNGLLAAGYLVEEDRKYTLGPGPYVLTQMSNPLVARGYRHELLAQLQAKVGGYLVLAVLVGDTSVYIDEVTDDPERSPLFTFVAENRTRRPLLRTAAGQMLLASLDGPRRDAVLRGFGREDEDDVRRFLANLRHIRATRLAFNRGATLPDVFAVATPLRNEQGNVLGAVSFVGGPDDAAHLDGIGARLRAAIDALGQDPASVSEKTA
jgi:DNA-binding IclR family transcriptional regulator